MKCYFRSFDVGVGDCNVIRLVDGEQQYSIMVDCGKFTVPVKEYVEDVLHNHINILVATHIDSDHIVGLTKLLLEMPDLRIDNIWYNIYRRKHSGTCDDLTTQQQEILEWVKMELPVEFDAINYRRDISAPQAKSLARCILNKIEWEKVWNVEYITNKTKDFQLPGNFGKIIFLSPAIDSLNAIENKVKDAFNKFFMEQWNDGIDNGEEISELLIRLAEAYKVKFELKQISYSESSYDAAFIRNQADFETVDDSDTNLSSIAFLLECGNHRVVMLGDSYSNIVDETLQEKYAEEGFPLACDAIKISHHGSGGNSNKSLLAKIQADYYFIPGGRDEDYPTWSTFGRIVQSHHGKKKVIFSHSCDMSKRISNIGEVVKQELMVETFINEIEYELFEW